MSSNLDRFKKDLNKLLLQGNEMLLDIHMEASSAESLTSAQRQTLDQVKGSFQRNYQRWYTESCSVVKQLLPDRLPEIVRLYEGEGKRKEVNVTNFTIQDWLNGMRAVAGGFNDVGCVATRFNTQLQILESLEARFESSLFDIAQIV